MDEIQRILVKVGRKDLAQKYYTKISQHTDIKILQKICDNWISEYGPDEDGFCDVKYGGNVIEFGTRKEQKQLDSKARAILTEEWENNLKEFIKFLKHEQQAKLFSGNYHITELGPNGGTIVKKEN